jgi:beta-lactamase class A
MLLCIRCRHLAHRINDIAVMWPKGRQPVIVAAYITQCPGPEEKRATILANIGRLVRESVS